MRSRRYLLLLGGVVVAAAVLFFRTPLFQALSPHRAVSPTLPSSTRRPNVVLISVDTTRPDHLGCYGYQRNTSPNIDRLAQGGVRFAQARTQAPWTLPAHMSLFTSMLPSHNTVECFSAVLPSAIPTLAQVLQGHGYRTAALVNNAQMKARWGFGRGFDLWREFPADTPQGDCEHLTAEALQWLDSGPAEPFFLFLHYYDPHDPYDPPERFRTAFGSSLSGDQAKRVIVQLHNPQTPVADRELFEQAIGSYDGEIAWVDSELGKLFARLPEDTLVVLFSDHGEAFKEHGWTQHGGNLYEEEVRSVLILRHPHLLPGPRVIEESVMLMDVAPTVLSLCGIEPPPHYEGTDLTPLWHGRRLPDRLILSETKSVFEGRIVKAALLGDWKLIYSLFDGTQELYHLPDEHTDLAGKESPMVKTLSPVLRDWVAREDYWMVYARGRGEFTATVVAQGCRFVDLIPFGDGREEDRYEAEPTGRWYRWTSRPGGRTRALYVQLVLPDAALSLDFQIDGVRHPDKVHLGPHQDHPKQLPVEVKLEESASSPVIEKPFRPGQDGFYVMRHRGRGRTSVPVQAGPLDEDTIRQLRSLGYLR